MSFRVGGGAFDAGGGGATAVAVGFGLREGDSEEGDQGIEGRALVMLLSDIVLPAWSLSTGLVGSTRDQHGQKCEACTETRVVV